MNEPIRFDEDSGAYVDCRVKRGFPLGGIGAGQICLNTDGSFGELRSNNNWMCPVRGLAGSFFALHAKSAAESSACDVAAEHSPILKGRGVLCRYGRAAMEWASSLE